MNTFPAGGDGQGPGSGNPPERRESDAGKAAEVTGLAEATTAARMENLPALLARADAAAVSAGLDSEGRFSVRLAVEELCVNVIKHGYRAGLPGELTLRFDVSPEGLAVVVADRAPLFDPAGAPPPDLESDWSERRIGGLGVHMVRNVTDRFRHEARAGGGNLVTIEKRRRAE